MAFGDANISPKEGATPALRREVEQGRRRGIVMAAAESSFIMLPLIVTAIVEATHSHYVQIIATPEWAFGASVLSGQLILADAQALGPRHASDAWPVALLAFYIVALLVPAMTVLTLVLSMEEPPFILDLSQVLIFAASLLAFIVAGGVRGTKAALSKERDPSRGH